MNLSDFCRRITGPDARLLPENHKLGARLICPEYSKSVQEVKTYPLLSQDRSFLLCWNFDSPGNLYATMMPSPENFCYHYSYSDGEYTQLHTHDYLELSYVVDGEFHQRILNKDVVFQKGELCLIDKNCLHQDCLTDQSGVVLFLHFRPSAGASEALDDSLLLLLKESYSPDSGSRYITKGLLFRIFRILSTQYDFSLSKEQKQTMNWIVFEEISDYIRAHFRDITIQDLVDEFHYQEDYFNRLIKRKTGLTYSAYVQQIRLERAEHLLVSTDKSIEEIADSVGYHNKGYFYKLFQEKYEETPASYRRHTR